MPQFSVPRSSCEETRSRVPSIVRQIVPAALLMSAAFIGLMLDAANGEPDREAARTAHAVATSTAVRSTTIRLDLAGLEATAFADNELK